MEQDRRGCVQVYTGNGKGKTTAAVGLAVRAAGAGLRVYFAQFAKGQPTGEASVFKLCGDRITFRQFGRPGFIHGEPPAEDVAAAQAGLHEAETALASGEYDVVILDEANITVALKLLTVEDLLRLLERRPPQVELVLTGRNAHPRVIAAADLVTEMGEIKHYAAAGVPARRGIEY